MVIGHFHSIFFFIKKNVLVSNFNAFYKELLVESEAEEIIPFIFILEPTN